MSRRAALGAALAAALAACGGPDADPAAEVVERDSAGVRIIEIPAGAAEAAPEWSVAAAPAGTLGSEQGADLFRVVGALRLTDGRIAVANGGSAELVLYDPRDGSVRRLGRKGGGPGEFERIAGLWRAGGDTLLVYDGTLSRVTPLVPDSGFLSPVAVPRGDLDGLVTLRGRLDDGHYAALLVPAHHGEPQPGLVDVVGRIAWVKPGEEPRPFATLRIGQSYVQTSRERTEYTVVPFAPGGATVVGADAVHAAATERFEIVSYDTSGAAARVIRRPVPQREVRPADVAAEKARWTANGADAADTERRFAAMPIPRQHPVLARLAAGTDGHLWVAETTADADAPTPWSVFDADGRMIGRAATPPRFRLTDVGADYLLGIATDEDDVEQVVWYRLDRP